MFTYHKNLTFIFGPYMVNSTQPRHVLSKIQRLAMILASFKYEVIHISGEENIWANLLSRWGGTKTTKKISLSAFFLRQSVHMMRTISNGQMLLISRILNRNKKQMKTLQL